MGAWKCFAMNVNALCVLSSDFAHVETDKFKLETRQSIFLGTTGGNHKDPSKESSPNASSFRLKDNVLVSVYFDWVYCTLIRKTKLIFSYFNVNGRSSIS